MLESLTDCVAIVLGPNFRSENADPRELDKIAKPLSTMIARRPLIQNVIKRFSAPAMFAGAVFAYAAPRALNLKRPQPPAALRLVQPADPPAAAVREHGGGEQPAAPAPVQSPPTQVRLSPDAAEQAIDAIRSRVAALG